MAGIPSASLYPTALDTILSLFAAPVDQFSTTLSVGINASVTSFVVVDSIASIAVPTYLAFDTGEIVYVEAKTDGTKTFSTVTRSANPQPHLAGEVIRQVLTANYINQFRKAIIAIETILGADPSVVATYASVHAAVVDYIAFKASKAAASGLASLNGSTKVVENPANATATKTASKIPIADANGLLDTWISAADLTTPGKVEVATAAETTTGSDATRCVSPDGLSGSSIFGVKTVSLQLNGPVALTTSDRAKFKVPAAFNGMILTSVTFNLGADDTTGSSSSGTVTITVQKGTTNMLTTSPAATATNYNPTTAAVIKSGGSLPDATVATGDVINVEVSGAGTGVTYCLVTLEFQLP
jgi:hypothetical protein